VNVSSVAPPAPWRWKNTSTGALEPIGPAAFSASGVGVLAARDAPLPSSLPPQPVTSASTNAAIGHHLTTGPPPLVRQPSVLTDRFRRYTPRP
jgi:hypothetical protein